MLYDSAKDKKNSILHKGSDFMDGQYVVIGGVVKEYTDEQILLMAYYSLAETKEDEKNNKDDINNIVKAFYFKKYIKDECEYYISSKYDDLVEESIDDIIYLLYNIRFNFDLSVCIPWMDKEICNSLEVYSYWKDRYYADEDKSDICHDRYNNCYSEFYDSIMKHYNELKATILENKKTEEHNELTNKNQHLEKDNRELINMLVNEMSNNKELMNKLNEMNTNNKELTKTIKKLKDK